MSSDFAVETHNLVRRFGGRVAVDDVTLCIPPGGIHALVGRNGAGKSTLYRLLLGFLAPSSGGCRVLGVDSAALPPAVRGRVGCVYESHPLPGWLRVEELRRMQSALHSGWSEPTFREIASHFQLPAEKFVRQLSRGERAGLALALAVAASPELLLLDEPTLGLDVVASRAFLESLLFAGERELGTIVYSSHQMAEVERVADRLIVLDRGAVVAQSAPDELRSRITAWSIDEWPGERGPAAIPGLLEGRRIDGQFNIIVIDQGEDFPQWLEAEGGRGIAPVPLGFERAMDAFLQGQGAGAGRAR